MATWKERGEVLDSEDDDDNEDFDSQSCNSNTQSVKSKSVSHERLEERPRNHETKNESAVIASASESALGAAVGKEGRLATADEDLETPEEAVDFVEVVDVEKQTEGTNTRIGKVLAEDRTTQLEEVTRSERVQDYRKLEIGLFETPRSSPNSTANPSLSPLWFQTGSQKENTSSLPPLSNSNLSQPQDDISKSFVELHAHIPSSPLGRLPSLSPKAGSSNLQGDSNGPHRANAIAGNSPTPSPPQIAKRIFRQRKQIQLHPYEIEQQKYQRSLKERGIAPIHIATSQEARRRIGGSPDVDSQTPDVFHELGDSSDDGFIATGDSQTLPNPALELSSPVPESRRNPLQSQDLDQVSNQQTLASSDEEEFPDVEHLLKQRPKAVSSILKPRVKTYSVKSKRPRLSYEPASMLLSQASIFDVPASPPATSSPPQSANQRTLSRSTSITSRKSIGIELPHFRPTNQQESIPTPATSSVRRPQTIYIDSELESEDQRIGGKDRDESDLSSSDESVEIRRVGKRVRGVLPASHLRLDLQNRKRSVPRFPRYQSRSTSPPSTRRGIALPAMRVNTQGPNISTGFGVGLLEGLSDDDENDDTSLLVDNDVVRLEAEDSLDQSRMGVAEEEDTIDSMLPTRKRSTVHRNHPQKRRRTGVSQRSPSGVTRQPKITDHLGDDYPLVESRRRMTATLSRKRKRVNEITHSKTLVAPRLSILDAIKAPNDQHQPLFIRIAARTVRTRKDLGRHLPTRKYIRLANREDTQDAQSVLEDWKKRKIEPVELRRVIAKQSIAVKHTYQQDEHNHQSRSRATARTVESLHRRAANSRPRSSRKLAITNGPQQTMEAFIFREKTPSNTQRLTAGDFQSVHRKPSVNRSNTWDQQPKSRPGQLERIDTSVSIKTQPSFQASKQILDSLYRASRKRAAVQMELPLGRFLADQDDPFPSTEPSNENIGLSARPHLRKTLQPRRLDVGAAEYRQPSNPLILEVIDNNELRNQNPHQNKLQGLGKFGTKYPVGFDIQPLPPGVFFHNSTFIGSGRLAMALTDNAILKTPTSMTFALGAEHFVWSSWNDKVSSEFGICFDWIAERINTAEEVSGFDEGVDTVTVIDQLRTYLQNHITFSQPQHMRNFLVRTTSVLEDFVKIVDNCQGARTHAESHLKIWQSACLLCFRILILAQSDPLVSHLAFQIEGLLQMFARRYIKHLMRADLGNLRKLYDKLQYLSFRDRGIRTDETLIEHWITVLKIMTKARIPRSSFWDVVNLEKLFPEIKSTEQAPLMEQLWYFMFSLLPLCEFDDFGVLRTGQRHSIVFDNWTLPQQLIRRVFELYGRNQRQSPSFNDYCRALLNRCHYLIVEWGWWNCSGIIGTVFDIFASHNLAHLRNEEAYISPQFLLELDKDPSLSVVQDDRCFHIFLKMVALGIKHFDEVNNEKAVRNLIPRLLPNHDRQYPKEEEIHQRDLASLRNHHDLLCTLFWAAPIRNKPSPVLIQKLVVVENSHSQACLISFRAWENLVRYVMTASPTLDAFRPFSEWQKSALNALWHQYSNAETEVRQQALELSTVRSVAVTEAQIKDASKVNRDATMPILGMMLQAISHGRNFNMSLDVAKTFFNIDFLATVLEYRPVKDFSSKVIDILQYYIWLVGRPVREDYADDSQDSEFGTEVMSRFEAISELATIIVRPLQRHLQVILDKPYTDDQDYGLIVTCWASLVQLLADEKIQGFEFQTFVGSGRHALFNHNHARSDAKDTFWTAFLHDILIRYAPDQNSLDNLVTPDFDIGSEWLRLLTEPHTGRRAVMTTQISALLHEMGHSLLRFPVGPDGLALPTTEADQAKKDSRVVGAMKTKALLRWALSSMKGIVQGGPEARQCKVSPTQAKELFSSQLCYLMRSMQERLQAMDLRTKEHKAYVSQVQEVCEVIQVYCSRIRPLDNFFQNIGLHYWPPRDDPHRFAPFAKSFSLDLAGQNSHKSARSLFYFLQNSFDQTIARGEFQQYACNLKKAMREPTFLGFLIDELLSPMVEIGFEVQSVPSGWLFCLAYLPALSKVLCELLLEQGKACKLFYNSNAERTIYQWAIKAAEIIVFYLQLHQLSFKNAEANRLHTQYQDILATSIDFWHAILPGLRKHQPTHSSHLSQDSAFADLEHAFQQLAFNIKRTMQGADTIPITKLFTSTASFRGVYYDEFRTNLANYVLENWTVSRGGDDAIVLNKSGVKILFEDMNSKKRSTTELGMGGKVKSVGVRRPDLRRALIEFEQGVMDARLGRAGRLLMGVI